MISRFFTRPIVGKEKRYRNLQKAGGRYLFCVFAV